MAAEHWFRWHHGTVTDPKFRVIAARATTALQSSHGMSRAVTVGHVLAVWAAMLECASQASPRGELVGWCDEDVAVGLGMDEREVCEIRNAMQGKTLEGDALSGWNRRQIKAEDATAADRKRRQREREAAEKVTRANRDEKSRHGVSRNVTTETETETEEDSPNGESRAPADADAPAKDDRIPFKAIVDLYNSTMSGLSKVRELTNKRRTLIRSAWHVSPKRRNRAFWTAYFAECQDDPFLNGTGPYREPHANWRPDFDYLLRADVVTRVFERAMDRVEREREATA